MTKALVRPTVSTPSSVRTLLPGPTRSRRVPEDTQYRNRKEVGTDYVRRHLLTVGSGSGEVQSAPTAGSTGAPVGV